MSDDDRAAAGPADEGGPPKPASGPVPVRDLMRPGGPASGEEVEPAWDQDDREFEAGGEEWLARAAGRGSYGTGRRGTAALMAVHFYRTKEPETPLREALIPAGSFGTLMPEELVELLERATPIELDREG